MARLRFIMLTDSLTFESFTVVIDASTGSGSLVEYIGAARRHNGVATVAISYVVASAQLRQQYST